PNSPTIERMNALLDVPERFFIGLVPGAALGKGKRTANEGLSPTDCTREHTASTLMPAQSGLKDSVAPSPITLRRKMGPMTVSEANRRPPMRSFDRTPETIFTQLEGPSRPKSLPLIISTPWATLKGAYHCTPVPWSAPTARNIAPMRINTMA